MKIFIKGENHMNETVGEKLKHIRKRLNISQEALAKNICTQSEISRIENNKNLPSYFILLNISKKLGVDIKYFLSESHLREDYLNDVKQQLEVARRERNYELIDEIVRAEEKGTLFNKGENMRFLLWHKGIVQYHLNQDVDAAIKILLSCLSEKNIENLFTEMDIHVLNSIGIIYRNEKEHNKAIMYLERAHEIIKELPSVKKSRISVKVVYNLSKLYSDLGMIKQSNDLCQEGIKFCHEEEDMFLFAEFHYQLGRNHLIIKNSEQGIRYWEKAKDILMLQGKNSLAEIIQNEIEKYINENIID